MVEDNLTRIDENDQLQQPSPTLPTSPPVSGRMPSGSLLIDFLRNTTVDNTTSGPVSSERKRNLLAYFAADNGSPDLAERRLSRE
jgi:hypothetical protein